MEESIDTGIDTGTDEGSVQSDPIEEAARAKGWKPKEDYEGDNWVDAKEFVAREPLFDRIKGQSKEIKEMRKTIDAMAKHFQVATQAAVQEKITALRQEKRAAIERGDVDEVEQIDQAIYKQAQVKADIPTQSDLAPEIIEWVENNTWFNSNAEMRRFAVSFNEAYLAEHPGQLEASLKKTQEAVKKAFPEKFPTNQKRDTPPSVEGSAAPQSAGKRYTVDRLNQEQKIAYKQYVQVHKVLSHDEYFKSLDEIGELK